MKILYKNAQIHAAGEDCHGEFFYGWLITDGELIEAIGKGEPDVGIEGDFEEIDLGGAMLAPGLIDVHTHGRFGGDFNTADVDMMLKMSRSYLESGVTTLMPTLASDTIDGLYRSIEDVKRAQELGAENFVGVHLEGRYLNKKRRGAHAERLLAPLDASEIEQLIIKMKEVGKAHVSAALELDFDGSFTGAAIGNGATLGLAHSDATYEEARLAFDRGATALTHTYNAMSPFHYREGGGAAGAGLLDERVYCELIGDGFHVMPEGVEVAYKLKREKLVIITDSMEATGMPDGEYSIAGLPVTVKDKRAYTHEGAVAGSTLTLIDGVKNLANFVRIPFASAICHATVSPAKMLGIFDSVGSLEAGKIANMLVLDNDNNVREVIFKGNSVKGTIF